jgi:hypothetical protein
MNLGPLGEEAGEKYLKGISDMLNEANLDTSEYQTAMKEIFEIDWSNYDAIE